MTDTDFYSEIAGEYDAITGARQRAELAGAFVRELLARHTIRSAIDAACGTGLYTIPLAKAGVRAVGADISQEMLEQAGNNALLVGADIQWLCSPMQELYGKLAPGFDAVLCMGNSIPHLLGDADLDRTMDGFARLLNPGGVVVVQLLNYARVLAIQERIVGINRLGEKEYVRFYDFLPGRVRFNILEIDWSAPSPPHRLHSTELRPYTACEITRAMETHGFDRTTLYSGLSFGAFDEATDETVTILAIRQ